MVILYDEVCNVTTGWGLAHDPFESGRKSSKPLKNAPIFPNGKIRNSYYLTI
jgi:hypothetical protein